MQPKYVEHGEIHNLNYRKKDDTFASVGLTIRIPWEVEDTYEDDPDSYEDKELEYVEEIEAWLEKHGYELISISPLESEGTPFMIDDLKY